MEVSLSALSLRLPQGAQFWFAFVNQASVWPWRATNEVLIPLEQQARGGSGSVVEFFYSMPVTAPEIEVLLRKAGSEVVQPLVKQ